MKNFYYHNNDDNNYVDNYNDDDDDGYNDGAYGHNDRYVMIKSLIYIFSYDSSTLHFVYRNLNKEAYIMRQSCVPFTRLLVICLTYFSGNIYLQLSTGQLFNNNRRITFDLKTYKYFMAKCS